MLVFLCGARCMAELAVHIVDEVIPRQLIRQWVIPYSILMCLTTAVSSTEDWKVEMHVWQSLLNWLFLN